MKYLIKVSGLLLSAVVVFSFSSCRLMEDKIAPTVASTSPAEEADGAAVNAVISVTFSEKMDSDTVNDSSFLVSDELGPIAGTVICTGKTASFTPAVELNYFTGYTATITTDVTDEAGNELETEYTWTFITGIEPDTTAPAVALTDPEGGADEVTVNSMITVTFSEEMNASTIDSSSFILISEIEQAAGNVSCSGNTATFTPSADLAYDTQYTATITTAATDAAGNALEAEFVWTFTTGLKPDTTAPAVTLTNPADGADGIAVNTAVTVTFSEEMNASTIDSSSFILISEIEQAAGTVSCSGNTATFTPSADLEYETQYTARITTSVTDTAGNAPGAEYVWTFTTGIEPDTIAPVPGNSGILTAANVAQTSIYIGWAKASDNKSPDTDLQYRLYISASNNISSADDAEINGTAVNEYTASIEGLTVDNLMPDTAYYFNVIVKDNAGNKAVYSTLSISTLSNKSKGILLAYSDPNAQAVIEPVLIGLSYPYVKITDTADSPSFRNLTVSELQEYCAVFYMGIPSTGTINLLTAYLNAGGALYISDNDLGYRFYHLPFYSTYLQAIFVSDDGGNFLEGEGMMAGLNMNITNDPYPDSVMTGSGGVSIFKFAGTSYSGGIAVNRNGYKAIYTAFDFQYIQDYDDRVALVTVAADYLCAEYLQP